MFDMLCDIYLNCNEELVVNSAAWGIFFYIKGITVRYWFIYPFMIEW